MTVRSQADAARAPLLIEGFRLSAVDEAFQNDWTIPDSGEGARSNGQVITHEIEL